jgi:hypothetical protein
MAKTRGTSSKREKEEEEAALPMNPKHAEVSDASDDEAPEELELGVSKQVRCILEPTYSKFQLFLFIILPNTHPRRRTHNRRLPNVVKRNAKLLQLLLKLPRGGEPGVGKEMQSRMKK